MPVGRLKVKKSLQDIGPGYSSLRFKVLRNIELVIKIDKFKVVHLPVNGKRQED